jgi:VanZ family protein
VVKRVYFLLALFWTALVTYLSLIRSGKMPQIDIQNIDKIIHLIFHFVLTLLWFLFLKKHINSSNNGKSLAISFVFSIVFGIIIEFIQEFYTATRQADIFDVLANATGSILAIIAIVLLDKYNGIIDKI